MKVKNYKFILFQAETCHSKVKARTTVIVLYNGATGALYYIKRDHTPSRNALFLVKDKTSQRN